MDDRVTRCTLGLDLGTSGVRAVVLDERSRCMGRAEVRWPEAGLPADPEAWWNAARAVIRKLPGSARGRIGAMAVDGTSGTVLLAAPDGRPLSPALGYDVPAEAAWVKRLAGLAPEDSAVHGSGSGLARALQLWDGVDVSGPFQVLSQADWLSGRLAGDYSVADENNALKLGYDPVRRSWPDWMDVLPLPRACLPAVLPAGDPRGLLAPAVADQLDLPRDCVVAAGTTDSIAGFLAADSGRSGDGVTSLGTTIALKLRSPVAVFSPAHGVYSHRLGAGFLAGGASNSGGGVLARYFDAADLERLTPALDPDHDTGLGYYPLPRPGERFPSSDPDLAPRMAPRPADDAVFLQGLLEGMAAIETAGYRRLATLGAPAVRRVLTVGGGARNPAWQRIRSRYLGCPVEQAADGEAAVGAAVLARCALA